MSGQGREWKALRADLEARVLAGVTASEFMSGARAYRDAKAWEKHARWLLARMDELESGITLEAALDAREKPQPPAPVDFILRSGDLISLQWSGQVQTVEAGEIEYGTGGRPCGIRVRSLTETEAAAMAGEEHPE